jgi:hypothetical protein
MLLERDGAQHNGATGIAFRGENQGRHKACRVPVAKHMAIRGGRGCNPLKRKVLHRRIYPGALSLEHRASTYFAGAT